MENQKLTPSMKFRRKFLREFYAPVVKQLYQSVESDRSNAKQKIQDVLLQEWNKLQGICPVQQIETQLGRNQYSNLSPISHRQC